MFELSFPLKTYFLATFIYALAFFISFFKEKLSYLLLFFGLLVNLVSEISGRSIIWPYCNMFSEPYFLPLFFSAASLSIPSLRKEIKTSTFLVFISSLIPVFFSEGYYPPFTLMSKSIFSHLFHLFLFIGHGFMFISAYFALLCFFKNKDYRASVYRYSAIGFFILCITGTFGMIWSYVGRCDVISWNHYYFHSVGIWFYYMSIFHLYSKERLNKKALFLFVAGSILIFVFDYIPQIGGIHKPTLNERLYEVFQ